jgi:hypothetical protein
VSNVFAGCERHDGTADKQVLMAGSSGRHNDFHGIFGLLQLPM